MLRFVSDIIFLLCYLKVLLILSSPEKLRIDKIKNKNNYRFYNHDRNVVKSALRFKWSWKLKFTKTTDCQKFFVLFQELPVRWTRPGKPLNGGERHYRQRPSDALQRWNQIIQTFNKISLSSKIFLQRRN